MKKRILIICCFIIIAAAGIYAGLFVYKKAGISDLVISGKNDRLAADVVAKVGRKDISVTELKAYYAAMQNEVESIYSDKVWDFKVSENGTTYRDVLKSSVLEKIIFIKLVCSHADEYGVELTPDDNITIEEYVNDFFESISSDTAQRYNLTKEIVKGIYSDNVLCKKVYDKITLNAKSDADEDNCRQADLLRLVVYKYENTSEDGKNYYSDDELEIMRSNLKGYADKVTNANDFLMLAKRESEDDEVKITCGRESLDKSVAEKVMALKAGEMTGLLETDDGFYLYFCENPSNADATAKAVTEQTEKDRKMYFSSLYAKWKDNTSIEIDEEKVAAELK